MPIRLWHYAEMETPFGKGGVQPTFVCDACNLPIDDARDAFVLMKRDAMRQPHSDIAYVHPGACFQKVVSPDGKDGFTYADDLMAFAISLLKGAHLDHILRDEHRS